MPNQSLPSTTIRKSHREVRFGNYILGSTLGEGEFGKVKLGWRKDGKQPSQVAIKLIKRDSIPRGSERESKVHREINALKKLSHPNIVKLEEVLQNDKYVGIVLDYASGGELFDYIFRNKHLKDSMASKLFSQLISGVDYMHSKNIVHRDLKLENLLLDKHKNIIITDFGFVNSFTSTNELMKTSCGSPCYAAPELVLKNEPYEARKVDVWSCGVILYAMLAGYLPFDDDPENPEGTNISRLYNYISTTELTFPEFVQPLPRNLLRNILVPEPKYRYNLKQVRQHSWLSPHVSYLSVTPEEWDRTLSEKNINNIKPQIQSSQSRSRISDNNKRNNRSNNRFSMIEPSTSSFAISSSSNNNNTPHQLPTPSSRPPPRSYSSHQVYNTPNIPSKSSPFIKPLNDNITTTNEFSSTSNFKNTLQDLVNNNDKRNSIYSVSEYSELDINKKPSINNNTTANTTTGIGITNGIPNSRNKLQNPNPHSKPRPSSYHPGNVPDGPLNADFSYLMPKTKSQSSSNPIKEETVTPIKESQSDIIITPNKTINDTSNNNFASQTVFEDIFNNNNQKDTSPTFARNKANKENKDRESSTYSNISPSANIESFDIITNGNPPSPPVSSPIVNSNTTPNNNSEKRSSKYGTLGLLNDSSNKLNILPRSQSTRIKSSGSTYSVKSERKRFSIFGSFSGFGSNYDISSEEKDLNNNPQTNSGHHRQSKSISFSAKKSSTLNVPRERSASNAVYPNINNNEDIIITNGNLSPQKQRVKSGASNFTNNRRESISTTKKVLDFFRRRSVVKSN